jgi:hypothetical protein
VFCHEATLYPSQNAHILSAAYENGIGAMPTEARMAASKKGYENRLSAMSVEERMAASEKGSSNDKMGIAWEEKYAEFESYDGMPESRTTLHNWQKTQLRNGHASLNAKIRKELAEKKGSTVWSERRVKLFDCVDRKNCAKIGNAWEEKYDEFKSCVGMPKKGTKLYN